MTTKQLALIMAHIEKAIRIGMLEAAWLAAIVDHPGLTYNELTEQYGISRRDKLNGPGSRLRDKGLIESRYDIYGKLRHYPSEATAKLFADALKAGGAA